MFISCVKLVINFSYIYTEYRERLHIIKKTVRSYYKNNRRSFPWRETTDPYLITVSEIMLQQTQADRVVEPYLRFTNTFPNWQSLANAPLRDVLLLWKGLGYNRRAHALKTIAERVVHTYGGILPQEKEVLESFPGIGPATAGDIRAFAWNIPDVIIETNIRSVYIYHFCTDSESNIRDTDIIPHIEATLDTKNPRDWYYALMDYGHMLKKTIGNSSRRSKHYTKQGAFQGSRRQLRARILFLLTASPKSVHDLCIETGKQTEEVEHILAALEKEHIVEVVGRTWYIHGDATKA